MAKLTAITKETFSAKRWKKVPNYLFAANNSACVVSIQELPKALTDMPIGFIKSGDSYAIVAVLGLHNDTNLYVDDQGRWMGKYPPAAFRSYPFYLLPNDQNQLTLCIDEESGLVSDDLNDEPFLTDEGDLSETVAKVMGLLGAVHANMKATTVICSLLAKYGLIKEWDLEVEFEEGTHRVDGLYGIDENSLSELADEHFLELRRSGALTVAYCQLLSMQNIEGLIQRAQARSSTHFQSDIKELDLDSFGEDGNISFTNL
jgi:hypothetical protein